MKERVYDSNGVLHCIEGTEEFVERAKKRYKFEKKILKKKFKEDN